MSDQNFTFEHNGKSYTAEVDYDCDPEDPREFDNLGTMTCFHGRYNLGDPEPSFSDPDELQAHLDGDVFSLPLYLYDHSGITMSTTPFSCPWDSGQVGYIHCTDEKAAQWMPQNDGETYDEYKERIFDALRAEVALYSSYIENNVYVINVYETIIYEGIQDGDIDEDCDEDEPLLRTGHYGFIDSDVEAKIKKEFIDGLTD